MTLEEFLNKYETVTITKCNSFGIAHTVKSSSGIQITIGHLPTAKENIELALNNLAQSIEEAWAKEEAARKAARKAKIRRVVKF